MGRVLFWQRIWVIGAIERESEEVRLKLVYKRRGIDCKQFVFDNVETCSVVVTDCWRGFNDLNYPGFVHKTVNHSVNFVSPIDSTIHTNTIERLWRSLKKFVRGSRNMEELKTQLREFYFFP
jgi:hypothetical protein